MPAWRWWIVAVLAAVFSMHGVLLVSPSAGVGEAGAGAAQHAMTGFPVVVPLSDAVSAFPADPAVDALAPADDPLSDTQSGHGVGAHLWSLCLAILAGMALLGALVLRRRIAAADARTVAQLLCGMRRWPGLSRPPDLAALCLLRV